MERFFINLVLIRVMYAHTLVAEPRLALGWLSPLARLIGDPRLGMTGIFLSLSRVLPAAYPLDDDLGRYVDDESSLGHLLDVGVIVPRLARLYDWSANELGSPRPQGAVGRPGTDPDLCVGSAGLRRVASGAVPAREGRAATGPRGCLGDDCRCRWLAWSAHAHQLERST